MVTLRVETTVFVTVLPEVGVNFEDERVTLGDFVGTSVKVSDLFTEWVIVCERPMPVEERDTVTF